MSPDTSLVLPAVIFDVRRRSLPTASMYGNCSSSGSGKSCGKKTQNRGYRTVSSVVTVCRINLRSAPRARGQTRCPHTRPDTRVERHRLERGAAAPASVSGSRHCSSPPSPGAVQHRGRYPFKAGTGTTGTADRMGHRARPDGLGADAPRVTAAL